MDTDSKELEPVVFRKWRSQPKTVIALFPAIEDDKPRAHVMSYEHIGQHGGASWGIVASRTTLATPEEYKDLKEELESIGYKLKVYKRWTRR